MTTRADKHDLGRKRGVWVPNDDVEAHLLNGWSIADIAPDAVLMARPAVKQREAA